MKIVELQEKLDLSYKKNEEVEKQREMSEAKCQVLEERLKQPMVKSPAKWQINVERAPKEGSSHVDGSYAAKSNKVNGKNWAFSFQIDCKAFRPIVFQCSKASPFHCILLCSFFLFSPIPFYPALIYSIPFQFHFILLYSNLFYSSPLQSIPFHSTEIQRILFHSILFHSVLFHLNHSIPFHPTPFHSISLSFTPL